MVSDDFEAILQLRGVRLVDLLTFQTRFYFIETPLEYFTHYIPYYFFGLYNTWAIDGFKIAYTVLACVLLRLFFGLYLDDVRAWVASWLVLFYPSHDATAFWFQSYYLPLSIALYAYAFYAVRRGRNAVAVLAAFAGSFISYGSPPVALALAVMCLASRQVKGTLVLLGPNLIYTAYYLALSATGAGRVRLAGDLDVPHLIAGLGAQVATFLDAVVGPSFWLKVVYAPLQLSLGSIAVALVCAALLWRVPLSPHGYNRRLLAGLTVLAGSALVMFALTGGYLQMAFNLGDRVTIFGGALVAYVLAGAPPRVARVVWLALIVVALGVADHWRDWAQRQALVVSRIEQNTALKQLPAGTTVFVTGHQYSRYGPFSHVEFLSEDWVVNVVVRLATRGDMSGRSLNPRLTYAGGVLVDRKYGVTTPIDAPLTVYDSERDVAIQIRPEDVAGVLRRLPAERRHWVQFVDSQFVRQIVVWFAPRLDYLFPSAADVTVPAALPRPPAGPDSGH